jgi:hypothetical protein
MAAIGNSPTQQAFTPAIDYFSGNGSTTAFTLSRPVASVAQVQVVIDNVAQNPSSAYTVSANTITFTSAPLSGTNNIYVYYTSPITQVIAPGQSTVGLTQFTATGTPSASTYLRGDNTWGAIAANAISNGTSNVTIAASNGAITAATAGTTAVTIDTSQNVGIGNSNPTIRLDVVGASATSAAIIKPQGSLPNNNDNAGLYVLHQGTGGAGFRVRTDNAVSASQFAHILVNNASAACTALQVDQYGTSPIADFTKSGTVAMRIDANGYVTTPLQPAFHASKAGSPNTTSENPVQYDTVEFNTGSHYNNSTYRFTAPVAGKYFMTAQFNYYIGSGGARQIEVALKLNGGVWQTTDTFTTQTQGNNTHCSATVSAVMNLSAGDYVQGAWVSSSATINFYSAGLRNSFSGFLIG